MFVFVNLFRGNLAGDDFAKEAVSHIGQLLVASG
jgi:hypothetical protein